MCIISLVRGIIAFIIIVLAAIGLTIIVCKTSDSKPGICFETDKLNDRIVDLFKPK